MDLKNIGLPPSSRRAQMEKVVLARKVGVFLCEDKPEDERRTVEQVASQLARDISLEVRQTLAFELRRASVLPRELALQIARDVEEVSGPFLEHTDVFSPEDLAALVRELAEHARIAIARRPCIPGIVAVAIAEAGEERSVTFLIRNPGADLSEAARPVIRRFSGNRAMMDYLGARGDLAIDVVHQLIDKVSGACRTALVERYEVPSELADALSASAGSAGLVRWVRDASRGALNEYIRQLESRGALTDRLLGDVTRHGGVRLFESVMGFKTGIDIDTVEKVVRSGTSRHRLKLLKRAGYREERANRLEAALEEGLERLDDADAGK